ncbi:DNA mismatch repair endonuclease MutL [Psychrobacter sp. M13]|uniref:DNA mismatch repair endonuclease MutL n=1 Tax=Psychrobacter sp. M13 TaxID=3067275 RepID=UPI00273C6B49|nr:DNA mismatch repair endonuclease MutL [Psychrobacter sp. M13]WLP95571.1 DNA mismatch repair endonuclease MutL [Psychrobacter sp. M13]
MLDEKLQTRIKKLSPLLINQLAAGEVVTRPSAVVKELLENAIDANATHIEVRITQGGMGMVEVVDDGEGIHPDDMVMAITRHATSKVADVANLHGISTLGFRGEALAATAAVSRLSLNSSHDDSGIGRQLQVSGVLADEPKLVPVVRTRGTTITVKDLYFNVPARRGNLKSIATEFAHIETIVREVALAHADVALSLFHDNKKRLSLSAQAQGNKANSLSNTDNRLPLSRLEQALGVALVDNALEVNVDLTPLMQQTSDSNLQYPAADFMTSIASISGWLWPSCDAQASSALLPKLLYINGRLVKEPLISNQLRQLAQSEQLGSMGYALYFELPLHWLNINVHPSKQRIKISSLNNVMAHLSHAVSMQLKSIERKENSSAITDVNTETDVSTSSQKVQHSSKVEESLQPYRHSMVDEPLALDNLVANSYAKSNQLVVNSKLNPRVNSTDDTVVANAISGFELPQSFELPRCLEVIDSLAESLELDSINSLSHLPWLLFYRTGEMVLISQQAWQASLVALFKVSSLAIYKNVTDAADINQQLVSYATQMSKPDFIAFKADIDNILTTKAIKTLDSAQLIALLLSPYSL